MANCLETAPSIIRLYGVLALMIDLDIAYIHICVLSPAPLSLSHQLSDQVQSPCS